MSNIALVISVGLEISKDEALDLIDRYREETKKDTVTLFAELMENFKEQDFLPPSVELEDLWEAIRPSKKKKKKQS